jgi:hypothetical protein
MDWSSLIALGAQRLANGSERGADNESSFVERLKIAQAERDRRRAEAQAERSKRESAAIQVTSAALPYKQDPYANMRDPSLPNDARATPRAEQGRFEPESAEKLAKTDKGLENAFYSALTTGKQAPATNTPAGGGAKESDAFPLADLIEGLGEGTPAPRAAAPVSMARRGPRWPWNPGAHEPSAQALHPYMTGASKRPNGRIRTDYQAEQVAGARGYVIVGDPGAGIAVTGGRQVGPNMWRVAPGAMFSVESSAGKDGARGYYFREAGLVG